MGDEDKKKFLLQAFEHFDTDDSGYISKDDLKKLIMKTAPEAINGM